MAPRPRGIAGAIGRPLANAGKPACCEAGAFRPQGGTRTMKLIKWIAPMLACAGFAAAPYAAHAQNFDDPKEFQAAQDLLKMRRRVLRANPGSRISAARRSTPRNTRSRGRTASASQTPASTIRGAWSAGPTCRLRSTRSRATSSRSRPPTRRARTTSRFPTSMPSSRAANATR